MGRLTRRQIAWIEITLGVLPPTVLWAMFVPAMVFVMTKFQSTASTMGFAILLIGGGAGLFALWSRLLPAALGRERSGDATSAWHGASIAAGLVASSVLLLLALNIRGDHTAMRWILALSALLPVAVALRLLIRPRRAP